MASVDKGEGGERKGKIRKRFFNFFFFCHNRLLKFSLAKDNFCFFFFQYSVTSSHDYDNKKTLKRRFAFKKKKKKIMRLINDDTQIRQSILAILFAKTLKKKKK